MSLSTRTIYVLFILAVLSACAAIIVPLEHKYATDPVQKASRGEITALDGLSLIRVANAQNALNAVAAKSQAESVVQNLVIRPTRMDLEVVVPADGSEHDYEVDPAFGVHADDVRDATSDHGTSFRTFDMTVPERMARAVLKQLGRPEGDVDYIVASIPSSADDQLEWLLYLQHGRIRDRVWRANADGSDLRRNGT